MGMQRDANLLDQSLLPAASYIMQNDNRTFKPTYAYARALVQLQAMHR